MEYDVIFLKGSIVNCLLIYKPTIVLSFLNIFNLLNYAKKLT